MECDGDLCDRLQIYNVGGQVSGQWTSLEVQSASGRGHVSYVWVDGQTINLEGLHHNGYFVETFTWRAVGPGGASSWVTSTLEMECNSYLQDYMGYDCVYYP